jgi:hypothetical protein
MPNRSFNVIVLPCESGAHASKLGKLLKARFAHRNVQIDLNQPIKLLGIVGADTLKDIDTALSAELRGAKCYAGEISWLDNGRISPAPMDFLPLTPPEKQ